jgi:hypothetical protein
MAATLPSRVAVEDGITRLRIEGDGDTFVPSGIDGEHGPPDTKVQWTRPGS